jgi:hypothetical protein
MKKAALGSGLFLEVNQGNSEAHGADFWLRCALLQGTLMGLDEVAYRTHDDITKSDIGMIGDGQKEFLFVRGNADRHDPVASFRHNSITFSNHVPFVQGKIPLNAKKSAVVIKTSCV